MYPILIIEEGESNQRQPPTNNQPPSKDSIHTVQKDFLLQKKYEYIIEEYLGRKGRYYLQVVQ